MKLSSGEEIICKVTEDNDSNEYIIEMPLILSAWPKMTSEGIQESISLRRWIHFADKKVFKIEKSKVLVTTPASVGLSQFYEMVVHRMENEWDEQLRSPTSEELDEIEMEEYFEEFGDISETIH